MSRRTTTAALSLGAVPVSVICVVAALVTDPRDALGEDFSVVVIGLLATGPLSLATALVRKTSAARSLLLAVAAIGVVVALAAALLLLVFAVECAEGSRCFG